MLTKDSSSNKPKKERIPLPSRGETVESIIGDWDRFYSLSDSPITNEEWNRLFLSFPICSVKWSNVFTSSFVKSTGDLIEVFDEKNLSILSENLELAGKKIELFYLLNGNFSSLGKQIAWSKQVIRFIKAFIACLEDAPSPLGRRQSNLETIRMTSVARGKFEANKPTFRKKRHILVDPHIRIRKKDHILYERRITITEAKFKQFLNLVKVWTKSTQASLTYVLSKLDSNFVLLPIYGSKKFDVRGVKNIADILKEYKKYILYLSSWVEERISKNDFEDRKFIPRFLLSNRNVDLFVFVILHN